MTVNDTNLTQAHAFDAQGRLDEAIALYRQVLNMEPGNGNALHLLGLALIRAGEIQQALSALSAAVHVQPRNPAMLSNLGILLSTLGRHQDAIDQFDRALQVAPSLASAHHARGRSLLFLGRIGQAAQALQSAARLAPKDANVQMDLGAAFDQLGQRDMALRHIDRAIGLDSNLAQAHHNRALIEISLGRHAQALSDLDRAAALAPGHPAVHANRGNVLADLGRFTEALTSYDRALQLQPRGAVTMRHRGRVLMSLGRHEDALESFDAAIALTPKDFEALFLRGVALAQLDQPAAAIESLNQALEIKPDFVEALNNRGVAQAQLDRPESALESFYSALRITPGDRSALLNVGNTLKTLHRYAESLEYFNRALAVTPRDPEVAWSKSLLLLAMGQFDDGWALYESRLELPHLHPLQRHRHLPRWDLVESLEGETLLIHAEQGLGDTLQFCRYVPMIEARGVTVIFEVQPQLKGLLQRLSMRGTIIGVGEKLPSFDVRTPLLSLPLAFQTQPNNIPAVAYLTPETSRIIYWRARLASVPGYNVGLAWQGNLDTEKQGGFHGRAFALQHAEPLTRIPGLNLISLQKGPGSEQRNQSPFTERLLQLTDPQQMNSDELLDTAALIKSLDLVITADTMIAHLAGALGVPVWVLLSWSPDWRWMIERSDTPWYPSMKLFRQTKRGDWAEVFEHVVTGLGAEIARKSA